MPGPWCRFLVCSGGCGGGCLGSGGGEGGGGGGGGDGSVGGGAAKLRREGGSLTEPIILLTISKLLKDTFPKQQHVCVDQYTLLLFEVRI